MTVQIGSVSREAPRQARHPHLVPSSALARLDSQEVLHHIQFMMKKDNLGQDIMLMGPPGRYRRDVVRLYASLTNREVEYLAVSRDTTFSDLKQRREIRDRTAAYSDQCVVRAAIHGRILLLDGIEKAERNGACTRAPVHPCTRAPICARCSWTSLGAHSTVCAALLRAHPRPPQCCPSSTTLWKTGR
jgi:hypothetical protein